MADTTAAGQPEKVWLVSNDNALIEVGKLALHSETNSPSCRCCACSKANMVPDRDVIERSVLIKNLLGDTEAKSTKETPIPIPNVRFPALQPPDSRSTCS